ncbi:MAG: hypothetical protein EU530_10110 [Promethearchaeota archaeon]|nr:MAG: hypothetical protein EU530_10110 [Candidatus Lokiarchaeota archaeon]
MNGTQKKNPVFGFITYSVYQFCHIIFRMIVYILESLDHDEIWQWSRVTAFTGYIWIIPYILMISNLKKLKSSDKIRDYKWVMIIFSITCIFNLSEFSVVYLIISVEFFYGIFVVYSIFRILFGILHIVFYILLHRFLEIPRFFSQYLIILSFISYFLYPILFSSRILFNFSILIDILINIEIITLAIFATLFIIGNSAMILYYYNKEKSRNEN